MKKKLPLALSIAGIMLLVSSLAFAQFANPWVTSYMLQNLNSTQDATVLINYYDQNGVQVTAANKTLNVPAGSSATVVQYTDDPNLPAGRYSAVVSSDQPLAAIVNEQTAPAGRTGMNSMPPFGSSSGVTEGALQVTLPEVMHNWYGYYTQMYIQNTADTDASVTITFYPGLAGAAGVTENATIKPYASYLADQKGKTALAATAGGRFSGSAVVTSNRPVAVVVNELNDAAIKLFSYNGFAAGATNLVCPSILRGHFGWYTSLAVANPSLTDSANVTITYKADTTYSNPPALRGTTVVKNFTIDPGKSILRYDGTGANPATDARTDLVTFTRFFGTAQVTSNRPVVAKVNQESDGGNAEAYNCIDFATGTTKIAVPMIQAKFYNFYTSLTIQNLSNTPGSVTINYMSDGTYSDPKNTPHSATHPITALGQINSWEGSAALGDVNGSNKFTRFNGSAIITANVPIVAIVNEEKVGTGADYGYSFNVVNVAP